MPAFIIPMYPVLWGEGQGGVEVAQPQVCAIALLPGPERTQSTQKTGGQGGIRTHGRLPPTAVFKTAALNHSATCPRFDVMPERKCQIDKIRPNFQALISNLSCSVQPAVGSTGAIRLSAETTADQYGGTHNGPENGTE